VNPDPLLARSIVIPQNAGTELQFYSTASWPGLTRPSPFKRQIRRSSPRMTSYKTVMAGLDPAILFHAADARIEAIEWLSHQAGP
jgi:hypothetical protein